MQNKLTEELAVCGFNAVSAVGEIHPETINRLFLREDRFMSFSKVCKSLAARRRPYKMCDDAELERICKSNHHQGVVAMITAPKVERLTRNDLEEWTREGATGLVLHLVGNTHNFGAMVRSAAFFGVRRVVMGDTDSEACLTTAAYRVAQGGMEYVTVKRVSDTVTFLKDASKKLITIGADPRGRWRIRDMSTIMLEKRMQARRGLAVVIGNEETGLPPKVKQECHYLVRAPGTGNIESLNAAQAATLLMHEIFEL
ncbi:MAG: RNA methyltransferase [Treponema sp.]|jgi:TrmH RNA methyltransferase|nr:RNA methyltransferase [Treponema sp.]